MGSERAGVADQTHFLGHQDTVVVDTGPVGHRLRMPGPARNEFFLAGEFQSDWTTGGDGQMGDDVLDQHLLLDTKATADTRLNDANVFDVASDERRQHTASVERNLGGGSDYETFVRVQPCDGDVRFDGALLNLVHPEGLFVVVVGC